MAFGIPTVETVMCLAPMPMVVLRKSMAGSTPAKLASGSPIPINTACAKAENQRQTGCPEPLVCTASHSTPVLLRKFTTQRLHVLHSHRRQRSYLLDGRHLRPLTRTILSP